MAQDPSSQQQPIFNIARIYLKGCSLEIPKGALIFTQNTDAPSNVDLNISANKLDNSYVEVTLRATVTAKYPDGSIVYLLESDFSGIFQIEGHSDEDTDQIMNVNCPSILIPYLRAFVHETMGKSNLPPIILPEINWFGMWQQNREANKNATLEAPTTIQ